MLFGNKVSKHFFLKTKMLQIQWVVVMCTV